VHCADFSAELREGDNSASASTSIYWKGISFKLLDEKTDKLKSYGDINVNV
jgi:hypothetical protein